MKQVVEAIEKIRLEGGNMAFEGLADRLQQDAKIRGKGKVSEADVK